MLGKIALLILLAYWLGMAQAAVVIQTHHLILPTLLGGLILGLLMIIGAVK